MPNHLFTDKSVRILIIDEHQSDIRLLKKILEGCDLRSEIIAVSNANDAFDYLHRTLRNGDIPIPNLILLDHSLPGKNGLKVLREIRKAPALVLIPVVILISPQLEEDLIASYELRANACIMKPLESENFIKIIKEFCDFWLTIVQLPESSIKN